MSRDDAFFAFLLGLVLGMVAATTTFVLSLPEGGC